MEIIDLIKNENQTSKWIVDNYSKDLLFVDDSFQRRYVWQEKHKIRLIETILMGYAIPEIYLWNVGTDSETGDTKQSIVDGQQRIGALVSYINDEFALNRIYLSDENKKATYSGQMFSELSPADKNKIWKYTFTFRLILEDVAKEDIVKLFLRLNSTDKSLNPQELRNAEFDGMFLKTAERIANMEFWEKNKIFTQEKLRRMGDIEFVSSLLIFLRFGVESEINQKAINAAYDLFENKYEDAESDVKIIERILDVMDEIIQFDNDILPYFKKTSHFYTIFTVIYKCISLEKEFDAQMIKRICEFYKNYENNDEYKMHFTEATRSKQSRLRRTEILSKAVEV